MPKLKPETQTGSIQDIDTLDSLISQGLALKFSRVFATPTVWDTSDDGVKMLQRQYKSEILSYPYALLTLDTWNIVEDKKNQRDASMRGVKIAVTDDNKKLHRVRLVPVEYAINVEIATDDWDYVTQVGRYWMLNCLTRKLNFQIDYGLTPVDVRVVLNSNFTFPKRDASSESVQEYKITNSLTVNSYVTIPETYEQDVIDQVEVSGVIPGGDGINEQTQVWTFRTPRTF